MSNDRTGAASSQAGTVRNGTPVAHSGAGPSYGSGARAMVEARARIGRHFNPKLFADPAFDILLMLFAAEEEGHKVNVSSCASAARVPQTTGLRYIMALEKEHLVERVADLLDRRRFFIRLTRSARTAMQHYLADISSIPLGQ